jgi:hypothetical protein
MLGLAPPTTTSISPDSKAVMAIGDERIATNSTARFSFLKNLASLAAQSGMKEAAAEG